MKGQLIVAVALNLIAVIVVAIAWKEIPTSTGLLAGLTLTGLSGLGAWWASQRQQPKGSLVLGLSSLLLLPAGLVGLVSAVQLWREQRLSQVMGRSFEQRQRPRHRAWTQGAIFCFFLAVLALLGTLLWLKNGRFQELSAALLVPSSALLTALLGLEGALLWSNRASAIRLGFGLCLAILAGLLLAGFYLHSYLAVAFLMLPVYLFVLVWQGGQQWRSRHKRSLGVTVKES